MKRVFNKLLLATTMLASASSAMAQNENYWALFPSTKLITRDPATGAVNTQAFGTIANQSISSTFRQTTNAAFDANGTLLFSVSAYGMYDASGNKFANIGGAHTEIEIVAIPNECKKFYVLYYVSNPGGGYSLEVRTIDASGTPMELGSAFSLEIETGTINIGLVAGAVNPATGSRDIYAIADGTIKRWLIDATGAFSNVLMVTFTAPAIENPGSPVELTADGRFLAYRAAGTDALAVYDLVNMTHTIYNGVVPGTSDRPIIKGIEFVPSLNRWYVTYSNEVAGAHEGGLGYYNVGTPNTFHREGSAANANAFGASDLELGKNGLLYFASAPDFATYGRVNLSHGTLWSHTPGTSTYTQVLNAGNSITISGISRNWDFYYLTNQIEGEHYNYFNKSVAPSFTVSGKPSGGITPLTPPELYVCNGTLPLDVNFNNYHTSVIVHVETGTITSSGFGYVFTPDPLQYSNMHTEATSSPTYSLDLASRFSWINGLVQGLRINVTSVSPCGSATRTYVFDLKGSDITQSDYMAIKHNAGIHIDKNLQQTLPITTTMPTGSPIAAFRSAIDMAVGWVGANTTMGIRNINTNGQYTLQVYEVDGTTGDRKYDAAYNKYAPNICSLQSACATPGSCPPIVNGVIRFNDETLYFDPANPPFYEDATSGSTGFDWFRDFYTWSWGQGTLTDYSAKTYCVDFSVVTPTGCAKTNKSYFRIANNGLANGAGAKGELSVDDIVSNDLQVYPNPATDQFQLQLPSYGNENELSLSDISGRIMLKQTNLTQDDNKINIRHLPAGTYIYKFVVGSEVYNGKIVKQ